MRRLQPMVTTRQPINAIVAVQIFWGEPLLPTSAPLPFYAYPFLVMTFIGWIWRLLHASD